MNRQLALAIQLNDEATFDNFCWGQNSILDQELQRTLAMNGGERFIYLWGVPGSGKSHLLQACCQALNIHRSAIYLPLKSLKEWGADVLEGLDEQTLIGIDDLDVIASDRVWEEKLFHLYNHIRDRENGILLMTGKLPPARLPIGMPDLRSRLSWGLVMQLHELNDDDKVHTFKLQAKQRGMELSVSVCHFLITRCARNMHDLHYLLDQLDQASLAAQRKITIPFVKEVLQL